MSSFLLYFLTLSRNDIKIMHEYYVRRTAFISSASIFYKARSEKTETIKKQTKGNEVIYNNANIKHIK